LLAELVHDALRDAERSPIGANVLTEDEDFRIAAHFLDERLANRFEIQDLTHRGP
jgi:hypothetical protein